MLRTDHSSSMMLTAVAAKQCDESQNGAHAALVAFLDWRPVVMVVGFMLVPRFLLRLVNSHASDAPREWDSLNTIIRERYGLQSNT